MKIIMIGLNNCAMPPLRYRTGDMVRGPPKYTECNCEKEISDIEEIIGRQGKVVITADGRHVPMLSYNVFKYANNIQQPRIVQETGDVPILQNVPDDGHTNKQVDVALKKPKERVGEDVTVAVDIRDQISRADAEKFGQWSAKVPNDHTFEVGTNG